MIWLTVASKNWRGTKMLDAVIEKQSLALMKIWCGEANPAEIAKAAMEASIEP